MKNQFMSPGVRRLFFFLVLSLMHLDRNSITSPFPREKHKVCDGCTLALVVPVPVLRRAAIERVFRARM